MLKKVQTYLILMLLTLFMLAVTEQGAAKEPYKKKKSGPALNKTFIQDLETVDGNRVFNYLQNNGLWSSHNNPLGHSMEWPGQSGNNVDFASGIWVGGQVNGDIRTAAAEFSSEWRPGNILPDGTPDDINKPVHQILKINKADLLDEGFNNPDYDVWVNEAYLLGAPIQRDENGNPILSASGKRIPDFIGDQMVWNVYNDADISGHNVFGSSPLGLECQNTIFVFNRPDAFGDMMFMKFLLINKGGSNIDSAFVGIWFDIDLGDANDDLVFSDTTLSLAGFWNEGSDQQFPIPPAVGADFFQGPIIPSPGDTALVSGRKIPDFKNLGMTSFAKYINSGPVNTADPDNAQEVYNFMLGLDGLGNDVINPITNEVTKFVNVSDPEAGTGWIDGVELAASDRRMLMNSGPFTMEPWQDLNGDGLAQPGEPGVQEVVVGWMIAQGTSAANSVTALKRADQSAQLAFDLNFQLPPSPPIPNVTISNTDEEVVLTWEGNAETYRAIDRVDVDANGDPTFYTFQGYNVYQVNTPVLGPDSKVVKLATFDIADGIGDIQDAVFSSEFGEVVNATVQRAPDTGLQRFFSITTDALNGGVPIRNWQTFWFVVTAYGVNLNGIPKVLESPFSVLEVVPQPPPGGVMPAASNGNVIAFFVNPDSTLNASHSSGASNGGIEVSVIDATKVQNADYQISFGANDDGETIWNLDRGGTRLLSNQTNQSGDNGYNVVDGLLVKVFGPPLVGQDWDFDGGRWISGADGSDGELMFGAVYLGPNFVGSSVAPADFRNIHFEWFVKQGFTDTNGNGAYDIGEPYQLTDGDGHQKAFMYQTWGSGNYRGFFDVPFAVFDSEANPPRQLNVLVRDRDDNGQWDLHDEDAGTEFNYVFIMDSDYDPTGAAFDPNQGGVDAFADILDGVQPILWVGWWGQRGSREPLGDTFTLDLIAPKVNTEADVFTFSTAGFGAVASQQQAQQEANSVNVFPNPYFGTNPLETDPVNRFVTFTHLPMDEPVIIRIFNLAGERIATIDEAERTEQGTFGTQTARWDLRNDEGVPVASGMYLVHVSMGNMGSKVIKMAVFQPEERLDTF